MIDSVDPCDEQTQSKLHVMGKDYQQSLLERVAPEELAAWLGGTATDAAWDYGP